MKLNKVKLAVGVLLSSLILSSCAKVNYDLQKPLSGLGVQNKLMSITNGSECVITEGQVNIPCVIKLDKPLEADLNVLWNIVETEANVLVASRMQSLNGVANALRGQDSLTLQLTAAQADNIAQGTKIFSIALKPANSDEVSSAKLTVLDLNTNNPVLPMLTYVDDNVTSDEQLKAQLAVKLSATPSEDVQFNIRLEDGTAKRGQDYNGFKVPGNPGQPELRNVSYPKEAAAHQLTLPEITMIKNTTCTSALKFYAVIEKVSVVGALIEENRATINIPCDRKEIILADNQKFIMTEGESRIFALKLVNKLQEDTVISWKLSPKQQVAINSRFNTFEGAVKVKNNSDLVNINPVAVAVNYLAEGDMDFDIEVSANGSSIGTAQLLLKDLVLTLPNAQFETPINADIKNANNQATISLDKPAEEDVFLTIISEDVTAKSGVDYVGINQQIKILKGQQSVVIPIEILKVDCNAKTFNLVVTEISGANMAKRSTRVLINGDSTKCGGSSLPPSVPPPIVAPKPDGAIR